MGILNEIPHISLIDIYQIYFLRVDEPFLKVHCVAIPDQLLESEFFGYEKGSFTGAGNTKVGILEIANGGL